MGEMRDYPIFSMVTVSPRSETEGFNSLHTVRKILCGQIRIEMIKWELRIRIKHSISWAYHLSIYT
jgi:hypothetical protein